MLWAKQEYEGKIKVLKGEACKQDSRISELEQKVLALEVLKDFEICNFPNISSYILGFYDSIFLDACRKRKSNCRLGKNRHWNIISRHYMICGTLLIDLFSIVASNAEVNAVIDR